MIEKAISVLVILVITISFIASVLTQVGTAVGGKADQPHAPSLKKEVVNTLHDLVPN
ncbi:MAG: hypothetical protein H0Z34_09445 [Brevibacillus sp.]|nr:hypothetical protein [Brevibacillus sp.]